MTIFIVDDEPKIRNGMGKLLSAHPRWQVQTFADAKSALHRLYEGEADVIITDIQMPDVSGLDMIESVRQVNKTVPILILSGYSRFDYAQRAIESGVRKYLTKPTDPVDLIAALEQIEREQCEQIQRLQRQAQKEPDLKPVDNLLVLRAIEYLQAHYAERIGLAQTAQALYISTTFPSFSARRPACASRSICCSCGWTNRARTCATFAIVFPTLRRWSGFRTHGISPSPSKSASI